MDIPEKVKNVKVEFQISFCFSLFDRWPLKPLTILSFGKYPKL